MLWYRASVVWSSVVMCCDMVRRYDRNGGVIWCGRDGFGEVG